ncbi:MAG: hypothetical protein IBX64_12385 [Actinobacteria bacterium]|nr:hypothetical protein [Actinomycetota bacterium]
MNIFLIVLGGIAIFIGITATLSNKADKFYGSLLLSYLDFWHKIIGINDKVARFCVVSVLHILFLSFIISNIRK